MDEDPVVLYSTRSGCEVFRYEYTERVGRGALSLLLLLLLLL